ncbi:hypothetical protein [Maribacter sp.]|uniref:hypothetical protein n=1 Tax=Maribacter sp. TaxID=1897614 RepID=UPI0025C089F6|nr:hypothetical protein [Maribacter sp.]
MKNSIKIKLAIAIILWAIGAVILYKKEGANFPIIISAVIIVIGFVSLIRKTKI